jgi:hypothetical protein
MTQQLVKYMIFSSFIVLVLALWQRDSFPGSRDVRQELLEEPEQRAVQSPAFKTTAGGITYDVQPLYTYDLYGLIVSKHDAKTWWDYIHKEWNDELNVLDLCVVWGNNVRDGAYKGIEFSSGQFVCNFSTSSREAYEAFDLTAISNNHLLSSDKRIAEKMRSARVGDQIHFRGYLAEYSHNHGFPFKRGTSTVRTDTGNGACETVYVESFEILRGGGGIWRKLVWISAGLLVAGVIAWFALPPRLPQ